MITYTANDLLFWNYFLAIEKDMELVSRYIEFSSNNENVYSIELARLIMSSASEVDVLMKSICKYYNMKSDNINDYRICIQSKLPTLCNEEVFINRYGLRFKPWENWKNNSDVNPVWWKSYNDVKHHRDQSFNEANLKNALNSIGALLLANIYYYDIKGNNNIKETIRLLSPGTEIYKLKSDYYYEILVV